MPFLLRSNLRLLAGLLVASGLAAWLGWVARPDPRIEALLDYRAPGAALDEEVVLAELPLLTDAEIRRIARELNYHTGVGVRLRSWVQEKLPVTRDWFPPDPEGGNRSLQAVRVLGLLGPRARIVEAEVVQLFTNGFPDWDGSLVAAWNRIRFPDPILSSNLVRTLEAAPGPSRLRLALPHCRGPSIPPSVLIPILTAGLEARGPDERLRAARALADYGPQASQAAPALMRHLADPARQVRPSAALALGMVAPQFAEIAVAAMLEQQRTNMMWTGDYAERLYRELGPAAVAAVPRLEKDLMDPRQSSFHGATAVALWRIQHTATPALVQALARDAERGRQRSQVWSLRALAEIGPAALEAAPALERVTHHPRILIRRLASEALEAVSRTNASPARSGSSS